MCPGDTNSGASWTLVNDAVFYPLIPNMSMVLGVHSWKLCSLMTLIFLFLTLYICFQVHLLAHLTPKEILTLLFLHNCPEILSTSLDLGRKLREGKVIWQVVWYILYHIVTSFYIYTMLGVSNHPLIVLPKYLYISFREVTQSNWRILGTKYQWPFEVVSTT